MPAGEIDIRSSSGPAVLLWIGVGLAPSGAALLVVGNANGLVRSGAVLAMAAIVLIGVGAAMSRSAAVSRGGSGSYGQDDLDAMREDMRADITYAAKTTHRALSDRIAALSETVEALRDQIEVLRTHVERDHLAAPVQPGRAAVASVPVGRPGGRDDGHGNGHGNVHGGGVLRHTETVHVTTRETTVVDSDGDDRYRDRGHVYGTRASAAVPRPRRAEPTHEVHLSERSAELHTDESATQMRLRDRRASVVERPAEQSDADSSRRRRRGGDDDEDYGYWTKLSQDLFEPAGSEPPAPTGRAAVAHPALPATGSGEPVPEWTSSRPVGRAVSGEPAPEWVTRHQTDRAGGAGSHDADSSGAVSIGAVSIGAGSRGSARRHDEDTERVTPDQRYRGTEYGRPAGTEYGRPAGRDDAWSEHPTAGRRGRRDPD